LARLIGILCGLLVLTACSFGSLIDTRAVEYNQVEEDVNNQILVTNILRARDKAPTYLAEFQNIHVSIAGTVGTGNVTIPFGPGQLAGKEYLTQPNASLTSNPTFDATQLDTQQFILGMLRPIDPVTWEYYWHRDYAPQVLLHLFLASTRDGLEEHKNLPCHDGAHSRSQCDDYAAFVSEVNDWSSRDVYLNIYTSLSPADPAAFRATGANSFPGVVRLVNNKSYYFLPSPTQVAICTPPTLPPHEQEELFRDLNRYEQDPCSVLRGEKGDNEQKAAAHAAKLSLLGNAAGLQGLSASGTSLSADELTVFACTHRQVVECKASWSNVQTSTSEGQGYVLRSVDGIIQYLGRVQQIVDADRNSDDVKKGVTWTVDGATHTLFQLHHLPGTDRIVVAYRGANYYVRQDDPTDHTLEVVALLNQLINANKNANEIPSTKAVQIVP